MLVANKLGRVVTYHVRLLLTKSLDRLITLSSEILRQTENISHNQSAYAHQTWQYGNLPWWAPAHKVSCHWSYSLARSSDKLKPLYLHFLNTYGHQTWWFGDLSWGAPIQLVLWPFNHVVLLYHVPKQKHLPQYLWPTNFAGWWNATKSFYLQS